MKRHFLLAICLFFLGKSFSQKIIPLVNKNGISIRGLSILDDHIAWVSGTKGTIGRTIDGGKSWIWSQIQGYENRDFRDIEVIDQHTITIMAIDTPAIILYSSDNGKNWKKVLEDKRAGMFLDAMSFDGNNAIVIGDPINGKLYLANSKDGGKSWQENNDLPFSKNGCFASSGTNIILKNQDYIAVSGGFSSHVCWNGKEYKLPLTQGKETTGANSIALNPDTNSKIKAVIVGGDFTNKDQSDSNCVLLTRQSTAGKKLTTKMPIKGPKGYKSCVIFVDKKRVIATGTSGTDVSFDEGFHWKHISDIPFHVVQKAKNGQLILLSGPNGSIATYSF